jgi:ligand-binding sensor domain-containing protein/serine phosphatase RsbU (regulator of sigma subunit)
MWFGTMDGLNKFDGYSFTVYKNSRLNKATLSHNYVIDLCLDSKGNLWIGSWGGLTKYDLRREVFTQYKHDRNNVNSIPNDLISAIAEDKDGNIWIGTSGGLVMFNQETNIFTTYRHDKSDPQSIGDDYVRDILIDKNNRIWVGTYAGGLNLLNVKTGKFTRYQHDDNDPASIINNCVFSVFEDSKGRMWLASHSVGFDLFDRDTGKFTHYVHEEGNPNSLGANAVSCFGEDSKGLIWVGAENGGISIFNPENGIFFNYLHDEIDNTTISNNSIYAIYRDVKGNMWVGTYAGGVNFFNVQASKFRHYKHNSSAGSLSNNYVMAFLEDSRGNIWIGTDGGGANLFDRESKKLSVFRNKPGDKNTICGDYVLTIAEDSDGNIWFGTWGTGISIYNPVTGRFRHIRHEPGRKGSLNSDNAWWIYRDRSDKMWVGTYRGEGLALYDKNTDSFTNFSNDPDDPFSLNNNYISYILEDSRGNFWIATRGGGLNLFDRKTKRFTAFTTDNGKKSISSNNVDYLFEDSRGNLWVTTDLGLNLWNPRTKDFTVYSINDGLPSDVICGILEDNNGYLWLSTINGISRFNPLNKTFTNYSVADGLQSEEFKPHAALRSRSGAMYFGGINGFNEFYPDSLMVKMTESPLYITGFKVFNRNISVGDTLNGRVLISRNLSETGEIVLLHDEAFFTLEFASLNYADSKKNQYAYMLEGFDKDWNYIGSGRMASYTDVPPGKYTFRVKATGNESIWKEMNMPLTIVVTPPYWNTWWFKIIAGLTVSGIVFSFYRYRIHSIETQKKILEEQVLQRTNDLRVAAVEISTQRDSLKKANENIMSSINYAYSIQNAILSSEEKINATVSEYFIIYKPKDVVSGDFYWFSHLDVEDLNYQTMTNYGADADQNFVAAVDCTGHGVSGAFMSIIGNTLFNEIVNQKHELDPAGILEALDEGLKKAIYSSGRSVNMAGMDVCLCRFQNYGKDLVKVFFAGARRPLYYVTAGSDKMEKLNGDIVSIGSDYKSEYTYTTKEIILPRGSLLYLSSDGFSDQNNDAGDRVGSSGMKRLIEEFCRLPLSEQKVHFEKFLEKHQGGQEQRDDITIIGIKI